ncbi:ABC transporter substrate-binding protein [Thiomicrorhabdus cannonii]|uniref:ABC transporter substrate-binding protein n=1 Tax=Thiomicrorhabdus cannonii TaxID=2748011 RepID=UPI0015BAA8C1|nr:ABC transporter substrate-binding protein [Thiomicrorhabdus cannonii]
MFSNPFKYRLYGFKLAGWLAILGLIVTFSCSTAKPLKIAVSPWIGYSLIYLTANDGKLNPLITLKPVRSATESMGALEKGEVDGAYFTLDEVIVMRARGVDLKIVAVVDISAGGDAIVARPDIVALQDLKGKRIGYEPSAVGALFLARLLSEAGLREDEIIKVPVARQDVQLELWRRQQIDAAITYEPLVSKLLREGAKKLYDSKSMPETIVDVLAVRSDRLETHADSVRALVAAHFQGLKRLRTNTMDALYQIAAQDGITLEEAKQSFTGVVFPSELNNRALLKQDSSLLQSAQFAKSVLMKEGIIEQDVELHDLFSDAFLPE